MDIVERLREVPVNTIHWVKCHDAADEIERLRIDLEVAEDRKTNAQLFQNDMLKEIERLRKQNAVLETELALVRSMLPNVKAYQTGTGDFTPLKDKE